MRFLRIAATLLCAVCWMPSARASDGARETLDQAWWTGPLLAANAGSLPQGHILFEPYFYDSKPFAHVDAKGRSHPAADENDFGSFVYILYGLTDGFTVGLIPRFGYDDGGAGRGSASVALGDWTVQGQYQLTQFQEGGFMPTISFNLGETFPIGHYDRLDRSADGLGAGAYTTILSLYSQSYFWMPTGRIVRTRLNLSYALSSGVGLEGASVYGTMAGFLGHARPTSSAYGDLAFEYSITSNWVAAIDFWLEQDANVRIEGRNAAAPVTFDSGVSRMLYVAPAIEYNLSSTLGVIFGARVFAAGRNARALATPVVAINYVH
ncbi:MAG TPA: hypothetical protein VN723_01015 [Rhizomicrobium sp.]|nr:hypothetical protein [Rhizomicrobium sp.]